uniref:Uncharacterized protein n=1 Tax=Megaviridae environmental sample TaxID=1737588 RepID=A0A5J6VIF9_9VIRU|nr:MAG: hypothetical protein [Megaviridae environmental sample]
MSLDILLVFPDIEYVYNANNGIYWNVKIDEIEKKVVKRNINKVNYHTETGQQISNKIFQDGINLSIVQELLQKSISESMIPQKFSDIDNMKNQEFVSNYLMKYTVMNNDCEIEIIIKLLNILLISSKYMSKLCRQKVQLITKSNNSCNRIPRNSYNFCKKTHLCVNRYPDDPKKGRCTCKNAHFVHNKIVEDISSLLIFIKNNYNNKGIMMIRDNKNKEIKKCINTIVYVIKHMYDELWALYISNKNIYTCLHRNNK